MNTYDDACLRLFEFNLNQAWKNNCSELSIKDAQGKKSLCGKCDTCQIKTQLDKVKPLLLNTNHLQLIKFLFKLIKIIKTQTKILEYLNSLLRPVIDSKDLTYSRNSKIVPSYDRDYLRIIKDADNTYISTFDTEIYNCTNWYLNSNTHVKLNFLINLFKKCDHSVIYMCYLQINRVLEKSSTSIESIKTPAREYLSDSCESINDDSSNQSSFIEELTDRTNYDFSGESDDDNENFISLERRTKYVDFIRQLPVYLSKTILSSVNLNTLKNCALVSKYWYNIVKEIRKDSHLNQALVDDMMVLRGTTSKICNPKYANDVDVIVPNLVPNTVKVQLLDGQKPIHQKSKNDFTWSIAYSGISTRFVIMEERNVFCGSYNVLLLKEKRDSHRVAHFSGSNIVALASLDKKIRFVDLKTASDKKLTIQGHAASIRCIYMNEIENYVLTGSYDTSIRCWNATTGRCMKIFQGHQSTVTCLAVCDTKIASGSYDRTCRVWSIWNKKESTVFKHKYPIVSVAINNDICVSGGINGKIRVFQISSKICLKSIQAHKGIVSGIKLDKWHIVTCGTDGYALAYSTQGKHDKCLIAMRHPKAVTCIEYQYLRVITGSSDGKIRIWNILNGDCLRVMRGNSQCDPINSLSIYDNKILINTEFNLLLMEFEKIKYEYGSKRELEMENQDLDKNHKARVSSSDKLKRPYSQIRANRMQLVCTPNSKLFNDERPPAMPQSFGPVSEKALQEARRVQQSRPSTSKMTIITLNTPQPYQSSTPYSNINRSGLSYINVQSEINSGYQTPALLYEDNYAKPIDYSTLSDAQLSKNMSLNETKHYLKSQLRLFKGIGQSEFVINDKLHDDQASANSCVESALVNRNASKEPLINTALKRPTSSPSRYDAQSKLKYYSKEIEQFINKHAPKGEEPKSKTIKNLPPESPRKTQHRIKSGVSKKFETQLITLDTNNLMYPKSVTSKLPTPHSIKVIRPATASACYNPSTKPDESVKKENSLLINNEIQKAPIKRKIRCQSALLSSKDNNLLENFATNKILAQDDLQLMTHKEIDKVINKMSELEKKVKTEKQKENDAMCKKIWLMKSTGLFHGSLIEATRPKFKAPEIRE